MDGQSAGPSFRCRLLFSLLRQRPPSAPPTQPAPPSPLRPAFRSSNALGAWQSFRDFLSHGFRGERATHADWKLHLNTLFPEARLKNTLEARSADAQRFEHATAVPALWVGLIYDELSLSRAEELSRELSVEALSAARPSLVARGLEASIDGVSARSYAERVLELAADGLDRRQLLDAAGHGERILLEALIALVSQGRTPADQVSQGLPLQQPLPVAELVQRTLLRRRPWAR